MFGKKKLSPKEQAREIKKDIRHNEVWMCVWVWCVCACARSLARSIDECV